MTSDTPYVCTYIREGLHFDEVDMSHANCLSFRLTKLCVYVYVVYRPPSNSPDENQALIDFIFNSCADKEVIILGDFNLPSISWSNLLPCGPSSATDIKFLDMFSTLGLTQWISECTFPRSGNVLDLILTSEHDRISTVYVQPPPPGCDHCSVHCEYVFDMEVELLSHHVQRLLWHRGQYGRMNSVLDDTDWDFEFAHLSAHEAFTRLLAILEPLIEQYVPRARQDDRGNKIPWKTNPPSSLKRRRQGSMCEYVYVVYRPPSNSPDENQALIDFIFNSCADKEVIILGDFNLPSISWSNLLPCGPSSATDIKFLDMFSTLGLTQWISECTFPRSGNVLDLILTSEHDRISTVYVQPPPPGSDHCSVHCEYVFDMEVELLSHHVQRLLWHRGQYGRMNSVLDDTDWDFEFAHLSAHEAFTRLLAILEPLIEQYVPRARQDDRGNKIPWKTNPPSSLKRRRKAAWEEYKSLRSKDGRRAPNTVSALMAFLQVNGQLRSFASISQIEYEKSLIARSKDNPKLLHSYIKHKKQFRSSVGPLRLGSNAVTDVPKEMADCFLDAFSSIHTTTIPANPAPHQRCGAVLDDVTFSPADVYATLSGLDPNSAMGQDGLHPQLLKSCAATLATPLFRICRQSLLESTLPLAWKSSLVVPIFKKGSRHDPKNYRPVSHTSVSCKSLERIISKELHAFLADNQILTEEQFGFRPGRSTEDQLLLTYDEISASVDSGFPVDLIMFDFSKAFDVVCHAVLLEKLRLLGIQGCLIGWLEDFLVGRTMQVIVKSTTSDTREVRSGVPQGSVLGPSCSSYISTMWHQTSLVAIRSLWMT